MSLDVDWKGLYRAGGVSSVIAGILFIIGLLLFVVYSPFFSTGQEALKFVEGQFLLFQTENGIFLLAFIFLIPFSLALYPVLKEVQRTWVLLATALASVEIILSLGRLIAPYSLVRLNLELWRSLAGASEAQRAAYQAAVWDSGGIYTPTMSMLFLSVAVLIMGLAMLKGVFSKTAASLGVLTGVVNVIGNVGLGSFPYYFLATTTTLPFEAGWQQYVYITTVLGGIGLVLFAAWFVVVGWKLYTLG